MLYSFVLSFYSLVMAILSRRLHMWIMSLASASLLYLKYLLLPDT